MNDEDGAVISKSLQTRLTSLIQIQISYAWSLIMIISASIFIHMPPIIAMKSWGFLLNCFARFSLQLSRVLVGIWDGECITIKCSNCLYNLAHFGSALQRYAGYCSVWVQSIVGVIRLIPALCHRAASTTHPQETPRVGIVKWRLGMLYSKESSWFSSFPQISLLRGILWKVQPIYF